MALYDKSQLITEEKNLINSILADNEHGRKIYLLGSAEFGPTNEPILIKSTVGLYNKFGKQGTLIDAFHCVKYTDPKTKVYLVKTTGEHACLYLHVNQFGGDIGEDSFMIYAAESNEIYNDVQVVLAENYMKFIFPQEFGLPELVYSYDKYRTIDKLAEAINNDTRMKKNKLYAYYTCDATFKTKNAFDFQQGTQYLYGGFCGLNYTKDMLYNCLEKTYSILESEEIDVIVPVDAFMDDIYPNDSEEENTGYGEKFYHSDKDYLTTDSFGNQYSYMNQLINFCIKQLNFGIVTHGVIGYNPKPEESDYLYESDYLVNKYIACMEYNKKFLDYPFYSFMVSVVAGDLRYNHGTIIDNAYLAYAAFIAMAQINIGTTNIPFSKRLSIYEEFSEDVLSKLAENGIVAFRHSPLYNVPVVYDGITPSDDENLRLFINVRMIQMTISYINKLFQFFIGMNMLTLIQEDIIQNDLNIILNTIKNANIINEFGFKILPYYHEHEIKIQLSILTNYMTKAVNLAAIINAEFDEALI